MKTSLQYIKSITDDQIRYLLSRVGAYQTSSAVEVVRFWLRETEGSLTAEGGTLEVKHVFEYPEQGAVWLKVWAENEEGTATASFSLGWSVSYNWMWNTLVIHTYADPKKKPHLAQCEYSPTNFCHMWDTSGNIRSNFESNGMTLSEAVHAAFVNEGFPVRLDQLEELYDELSHKTAEMEWNN